MRIGVLTSVHPPTDTRIYFKEIQSLQDAGHEVILVARSGAATDRVKHIQLPVPRSRFSRMGTVLRLAQEALRLRCDAYHLHDPELLLIVPFLKRRTGARIVFDVHENIRRQIGNKYWIPRPLRRLVAALYDRVERYCLRWVDHVILAEDSYATDYSQWHTTIVRNYPILPKSAMDDRQRNYSRLPKLAYCGVVARIRGGLEMLEATALLRKHHPQVELHIIGPCFPSEFEAEMKQRIVELGLQENVRLYGRLPLDVAMQHVATCDIGLAMLHPDPNYLESLPTKMFEYMSLRMPVLVSNFPLWKGIVDDAECGYAIDPLQPAAIVDAVESILEDPGRQAAMGEMGRRAVLQKYSWAVEQERLLSVYDTAPTSPVVNQPEPRHRPTPAVPVA